MCSPICPTFLLPYRRYASVSLFPLARDYLEQDRLSYQKIVAPSGRAIGYVTPPDQEKIDERPAASHRPEGMVLSNEDSADRFGAAVLVAGRRLADEKRSKEVAKKENVKKDTISLYADTKKEGDEKEEDEADDEKEDFAV